jgi:hypothetical protein
LLVALLLFLGGEAMLGSGSEPDADVCGFAALLALLLAL